MGMTCLPVSLEINVAVICFFVGWRAYVSPSGHSVASAHLFGCTHGRAVIASPIPA
jgi:hypothetical protein